METKNNFAGFWLRFLAGALDGGILLIVIYLFLNPFFRLIGLDPEMYHLKLAELKALHPDTWFFYSLLSIIGISKSAFSAAHIIGKLIGLLYFSFMESSSKQATFGKLIIGLKVTDLNGNRISFVKALGRNLAKYISNFTFYIGYVIAGFTQKKQALHDILSNCYVVINK
ncbi:MAG: RDD family protein [Bacteroidia bacterium]